LTFWAQSRHPCFATSMAIATPPIPFDLEQSDPVASGALIENQDSWKPLDAHNASEAAPFYPNHMYQKALPTQVVTGRLSLCTSLPPVRGETPANIFSSVPNYIAFFLMWFGASLSTSCTDHPHTGRLWPTTNMSPPTRLL